jgi:adenylate cyclase
MTMLGNLAATLYGMLRRWPESQAHAEAALQLAINGRFPLWQANAMVLRGAALSQQGQLEDGIIVMTQGLAIWDRTGVRLAKPHAQARLAEAYLLAGQRKEGLALVDESLRSPQEAWWLPEQLRIRAELLLLAPGFEAEAETTLRQALEMTRSQGSRALSVRVATSLARLWQGSGRAEEGSALLAECLACLPEGHDLADGREAHELLEQLMPDRDPARGPLPPCFQAVLPAPMPMPRVAALAGSA